ncbi:MAG: hypothetical protein F6J89_33280 [Symploca sp. SIO1C4]|uniref:Uncharacterized protein n=1 Tax=Symploca sp. SIO1C4 TaxID=2607765 RepID=A0A6B3NSD7_9CYAN|nr:hypothetical protein [Symploca sp. SIO1C4]
MTTSSLASVSGNVSGNVTGNGQMITSNEPIINEAVIHQTINTSNEPILNEAVIHQTINTSDDRVINQSTNSSEPTLANSVTGNPMKIHSQEVACQREPIHNATSSVSGNWQPENPQKNTSEDININNPPAECLSTAASFNGSKSPESAKQTFKPGQTAIFRGVKVIVQYLVNEVVAVVRELDNPKAKQFEVAICHLIH